MEENGLILAGFGALKTPGGHPPPQFELILFDFSHKKHELSSHPSWGPISPASAHPRLECPPPFQYKSEVERNFKAHAHKYLPKEVADRGIKVIRIGYDDED